MSYIQGSQLLRQRVASYLSVAVPALLPIARTATGLTALQLPAPVRYDAYDPYIANEWPVLGMSVISDRDHVHRDVDAAAQREYWSLYSCQLFVGVITPKDSNGEYVTVNPFEETVRTRDAMLAVLKNALLASPSLGGFDVEVLEESMASDYGDPMTLNDKVKNIFVAAAVVNVDIRMSESLYLPALGTVATTGLTVVRVPEGGDL